MADALETDKILQLLESRIKTIEESVYSQNPGNKLEDRKIAETIFEAQRQLKDAEAKSAAASTVFKHLKSLDNYLSTEFLSRVTSTSDTKADIIIAGENRIKETAKRLEEIDKKKSVIEETRLLDVPQWNAKLEPLAQVQIQQVDDADETTARLNLLLTTYNNIISSLSKQFVQWDNVVTKCEIAVENSKTGNQE